MTRPMRVSRLLRSDSASTGVDRPAPVPPTGRPRPVPGAAPTHRRAGRPGDPTGAPGRGSGGDRRPRPRGREKVPARLTDAAATGRSAAPTGAGPERRAPRGDAHRRRRTRVRRPRTPPSPEDSGPWVLVRAAQAGDMNAFSDLFDRYYDVVFRYVLFRMNDRTLAEDVTQETFLRALRRITSVTYQGRDIGAWFVTIARNLIFDHVKSSRYRLESTTSDIVELSPSTHGPEQQVLDMATNEELLRCVRKLNADQQECISLRFLQGLSVAETAKIMDRNEGAVKALQHRAVRRLAQLLPEGLR